MINFEMPNYTYRVREIVRVIDGDTIDCWIDLGMHITAHKRIRFLTIDTYEMRGGTLETKTLARAAKARLTELLDTPDSKIYIKTQMDNTGKYGRLLGRLYVIRNSDNFIIDINNVLLEEGFVENVS